MEESHVYTASQHVNVYTQLDQNYPAVAIKTIRPLHTVRYKEATAAGAVDASSCAPSGRPAAALRRISSEMSLTGIEP